MIRILLFDLGSTSNALLRRALIDAGMGVLHDPCSADNIRPCIAQHDPDAILMVADRYSPEALQRISELADVMPHPILLLFDDERRLQVAASKAGFSTYIIENISPLPIRTLVEEALRHAQRESALMSELKQTQMNLEERRVIDRARCLLMEHNKIGEQEAYVYLKNRSMQQGIKLAEVARRVIVRASDQSVIRAC